MLKIVCFGEVLWDVFPNHKKIGGAPLNGALRLKSFNNKVSLISSVGDDENGKKLLDYISSHHVDISGIQINKDFKTGKVKVMLNEKGSASYDIKYPRAWDNIQLTEGAKTLVKSSDAFIFGSLSARDDISRDTLLKLIELAKYKIFDVNLRAPYYTKELLLDLMNQSDFIKFNDEELYEISKYLGSKFNSLEQNITFISQVTNTPHICVTKGEHGAILLYDDVFYYNSGYQIKVVDTVGAGDSFLASLLDKLLKKTNPQTAINFACAVGALVTNNEGANPIISLETIDKFINP